MERGKLGTLYIKLSLYIRNWVHMR